MLVNQNTSLNSGPTVVTSVLLTHGGFSPSGSPRAALPQAQGGLPCLILDARCEQVRKFGIIGTGADRDRHSFGTLEEMTS